MRERRIRILTVVTGYVLFALTAVVADILLMNSAGMDSLLAFLTSQMLAILLLYYMRRVLHLMGGTPFHSRGYGRFLLVNVLVLVTNALILNTAGDSTAIGQSGLQIYGTVICGAANGLLQAVQAREDRES